MSQAFFWKKLDDGALLLIAIAIFGAVQIYLSYIAAFVYLVLSALVLTLVPLGVVLTQAAATAILAELLGSRFFPYHTPRGSPAASSTRLYLRRFAIALLATLIVLGIWVGIYYLIFNFSYFTQIAYIVGYIIANVTGALLPLTLIVVVDFLFSP
ncbi:MAG: hypothetical protein ACXADB_05495 [Candidatus Hermodarchaeia archaeon]|jgi:hypothetical protein